MIFLLVFSAGFFCAGCDNPLLSSAGTSSEGTSSEGAPSDGTLSGGTNGVARVYTLMVYIAGEPAAQDRTARTALPAVPVSATYTISVSRGGSPLGSATVAKGGGAPYLVQLTDAPAVNDTVHVKSFDSGNVENASGSHTLAANNLNGTAPITVTLAPLPLGTGTGDVDLSVSFDPGTGTDTITGAKLRLYGSLADFRGGNPSDGPVTYTFTGTNPEIIPIKYTGLTSGNYVLTIDFYRAAGSTPVSRLIQAINVRGGLSTNTWVESGTDILTWDAFGSPNADLAYPGGIKINDAAITGYAASTISYNLYETIASVPTSITLNVTAGEAGQFITAKLNNGSDNILTSGTDTTLSSMAGTNSIVITVTAPDGVTTKTYTVNYTYRHTVTFNSKGGTPSLTAQTVDNGNKATDPADPLDPLVKTNLSFAGWYTDDTMFTTLWDFDTNTVTEGITLYAKWTATVSFNTNSVLSVADQIVTEGGTATAPTPTRPDLILEGWYTENTFATKWDFGTAVMAHRTLYARWTATVSFDDGGGTPAPISQTVTEDGKATAPATMTKTGYTFDDWYTENTFTTKWDFDTAVTADRTLYAKWEPITYTVAYDANGGDGGSTASSSHTYDVDKALTTNGFSRTGYDFAGWNTKADNSGTSYANNESVTNLSDTNATVNLYAQWTAINYSISYTLNGGANDSGNPANYTIESPDINLANPTRTGYIFNGWYNNSGFTGTAVASIPMGSTENKTFHAKWTPITYTVAYNANLGSGTMTSVSHTYDEGKDLTANTFTRTGYDFAGWNTKADNSGTSYANNESVTNLSDTNATVNLYAQWTAINYSISYTLNGGANDSGNPANYTIESAVITLANPARSNYEFGGWYDNSGFTGTAVASIPTGSTGNKTFYAKWNPQASITISLAPVPDDPSLSNATIFKDQQGDFSAAAGYEDYQWYWDGGTITGATTSTYILAPNLKTPGIYEISVVVTTGGGVKLSARCRVTIKARP